MVKPMKISARNQIPGTVKSIKKGPVSTEVVMTVAGGIEIVSSITTHSAEALKLKGRVEGLCDHEGLRSDGRN